MIEASLAFVFLLVFVGKAPNTSLGGFISVSSRPFQDALWHMDDAGKP